MTGVQEETAMNETAPPQKQDIRDIGDLLVAILAELRAIRKLVEAGEKGDH